MLWWTLRQLKSKNPETFNRAVKKTLNLKDIRVVDALIAALGGDRPPEVRSASAGALGSIGDRKAVEPLAAMLRETPVREVQIGGLTLGGALQGMAMTALGKIKDPAAVEPLIDWLQNPSKPVRPIAARTLGEIGGARAIEGLAIALKDQDENVREWAANALEMIGGPEVERVLAEHRSE